jgi:hypothetical protein
VSEYRPGVCNIGPEEIAMRRRSGHVAAAATVSLLSILVATNAPRWTRLFVGLPAAGAASGYLQARAHFCAGFGSRGVYNFGPVGEVQKVTDADDLAADKRTSRRIALQSGAVGLVAAAAAFGLPRR